jgi:hypothetical protein
MVYDTIVVNNIEMTDIEEAVDAINHIVFNLAGRIMTTLRGFEPKRRYRTNEAIVYEGAIYTAKVGFFSGTEFNADDWYKVGVSEAELAEKIDKSYAVNFEYVENKTRVIRSVGAATDTDYPSESAVRTELDRKADKIISHIDWNPSNFNIPAGRTLKFNDATVPKLTGTELPTIAMFAILDDNPDLMFGFFSNDSGATTQAGVFHINDDMTAFEADILLYDGEQWLNEGNFVLPYDIAGDWNEYIGDDTELNDFDLNLDISVLDVLSMNLIDVYNEAMKKQNLLTAGNNIDISNVDALHPVITAKTIMPDVNASDGEIADAKKTAAMIAEAVRSTHNRGKVISAYAPAQVWTLSSSSIAIPDRGIGYDVGDSVQYGLNYIDILLVITQVDETGAVLDYTISSTGANNVDFTAEAQAGLVMAGGSGMGFTIQGICDQGEGTTLADIPDPQPNDEVSVVLDETHSGQLWTWIFADYNGDEIYNWVSLAPAGNTRDFYLDPIETGEIAQRAITDTKVADYTTETVISEDNTRFSGGVTYSFKQFKDALVSKINALFTNKVNKTADADKIYGTDEEGEQTVYNKVDFGKVDTVNGITPAADKNVQTDYIYETKTDFEAAKDSIPVGATVIKMYEYPENFQYSITRPDKWPVNVEIDFGDGLYGQRFTGSISAAANTTANVNVKTISGFSALISGGGRMNTGVNWISVPYSNGEANPISVGAYYNDAGLLSLYTKSMHVRTNSPYDIWITYTKI